MRRRCSTAVGALLLALAPVWALPGIPEAMAGGSGPPGLPLSGVGATPEALQQLATNAGTNPLLFQGAASFIGADGAVTVVGVPNVTTQNSSKTASQVRANITGNVQKDINSSTVYLPALSTVIQGFSYSAYSQSDVGGSGSFGNTGGFFGMSACNSVNNCQTWGGNSIITDSLNSTVITAVTGNALIGWEYDFTGTSPNTNIVGISLKGATIQPPNSALGYTCSALSAVNPYKWTYCLYSENGRSTNAALIGATATSGTNINSQNVIFNYFDGGGVAQHYTLAVTGGQFSISSTGALATIATGQLSTTGIISVGGFGYFIDNTTAWPATGLQWATAVNHSNGGAEADFFNTFTVGIPSKSFSFYQMTGASAGTDLLDITYTGATFSSTVTATGAIMTAAAPTVAASQIGYGSTVSANTSCGTLASSAGCIIVNVAGTTRYIPYY